MNTTQEKLASRVAAGASVDPRYESETALLASDKTKGIVQDKASIEVRRPEIRWDLVNRVKAQIAAGTFETPERIEETVRRLAQELFED
jgi:hypothetical protein